MDPRYLTAEPKPRRQPKQKPLPLTVVGGQPLPTQGEPYSYGAPAATPAEWSLPQSTDVGTGQGEFQGFEQADPGGVHTSVEPQQPLPWWEQAGQWLGQGVQAIGQGVQGAVDTVGGLIPQDAQDALRTDYYRYGYPITQGHPEEILKDFVSNSPAGLTVRANQAAQQGGDEGYRDSQALNAAADESLSNQVMGMEGGAHIEGGAEGALRGAKVHGEIPAEAQGAVESAVKQHQGYVNPLEDLFAPHDPAPKDDLSAGLSEAMQKPGTPRPSRFSDEDFTPPPAGNLATADDVYRKNPGRFWSFPGLWIDRQGQLFNVQEHANAIHEALRRNPELAPEGYPLDSEKSPIGPEMVRAMQDAGWLRVSGPGRPGAVPTIEGIQAPTPQQMRTVATIVRHPDNPSHQIQWNFEERYRGGSPDLKSGTIGDFMRDAPVAGPPSAGELRPGAELEQVAPGAYKVDPQDLPEGTRPQDVGGAWKPSNNPDPTLRAVENSMTNPEESSLREPKVSWFERMFTDDKIGLRKLLDDAAETLLGKGKTADDLPTYMNPLRLLRAAPGGEETDMLVQRTFRPVFDIAKQIDPTELPKTPNGDANKGGGTRGELWINMYAHFKDAIEKAEATRRHAHDEEMNKPFGAVRGEEALADARARASLFETLAKKNPSSKKYSQWVSDALNLRNITIPKLETLVQGGKQTQQINRQIEANRRGSLAWAERKFPGNHDALAAQNALEEMERQLGPDKFALVEAGAAKLNDARAYMRARLLDSGVIDAATYSEWTNNFPDYVRTYIDAYDRSGNVVKGTASGQKILNTPGTDIKKLSAEGTTKSAIPPIQSMIMQMQQVEQLASRNEAFLSLVDLRQEMLNKDPGLDLGMRLVKNGESITKYESVISGISDGKPLSFAVPKGVDTAFDLGERWQGGRAVGFWMGADLVRVMATGGNPVWAATIGPARDLLSYGIRNTAWAVQHPQAAQVMMQILPYYVRALLDVFAGIMHGEFRGTDTQHALLAGVGMSYYSAGARKTSQNLLEHLRRDGSYMIPENPADAQRWLKDLVSLQWAKSVSGRLELAPRVATQKLWEDFGMDPHAAAMRGRDVTLDFQRGGFFIRALNSVLPFLNAGVQGPLAPVRMFRENPVGAAFALSSLGLISLVAELYNRSDSQRAYDYDNTPAYLKDTHLIIPLGGAHTDSTGNRRPDRFAYPMGEWAFVPSLIREAVKAGMGNATPDDIGPLLGALMYNSPMAAAFAFSGKNPLDTTLNLAPPALSIPIQAFMNHDSFRDRDINSAYANEQASSVAKGVSGVVTPVLGAIGDAIHSPTQWRLDPSYVDWVGQQVKPYYDPLVGAVDHMTGRNKDSTRPADWPVVGGFISKFDRDQTGGVVQGFAGRAGIEGWPVVKAFKDAGVELTDPPFDTEYDKVPGTKLRMNDDDRTRFIKDTGKLIKQMWEQTPENLRNDANTLKKIQEDARAQASRDVFAHLPPDEMAKRITIDPKPDGQKPPDDATKNALGLLTKLHDSQQFPPYLGPDGKPIGTPTLWAQWDDYLKDHANDPAALRHPGYAVLEDAKARGNTTKLDALWADPRYRDYTTWLGKNRAYTQAQIDDMQSGRNPKYKAGGPSQWEQYDHVLDRARTLPNGPEKNAYMRMVKQIRLYATSGWTAGANFDELELRNATDELNALESRYDPATGGLR